MTNSLTSTQQKLEKTKSSLSTMTSSLTSTQQELEETKSSLSTMTSSLTSTQQELEETRSSLSTMTSSLTSTQQELEETKSSLSTMTNSLTSTQQKLEETKSSLSTMTSSLTSTQQKLKLSEGKWKYFNYTRYASPEILYQYIIFYNTFRELYPLKLGDIEIRELIICSFFPQEKRRYYQHIDSDWLAASFKTINAGVLYITHYIVSCARITLHPFQSRNRNVL